MEKEDITSRDCPQGAGQDSIPEVAPAQGTAFLGSAWIQTRVPASPRAARRRAGTPAHAPRPSRACLPCRARSATRRARWLPALALRLPAPPHPPAPRRPLRASSGSEGNSSRSVAPGLRRRLRGAGQAAAWDSRDAQSASRVPLPPSPARLCQAHRLPRPRRAGQCPQC